MNNNLSINKPWHRHPLVWMLIAIPLSAVLMGVVLLTVSITSWDGLVADDYYKRGKEINRLLDRDRRAFELELSASLTINATDGVVHVELKSGQDDSYDVPDQLLFNTFFATRSGLDQKIVLNRGPDGSFYGLADNLKKGPWILQLEADDWRLSQRLFHESGRLDLQFKAES